jgi:RNA polymerase sigma-70 factor (ECF subfamily)
MSTNHISLQLPIHDPHIFVAQPVSQCVRSRTCIEDPNARLVDALKSHEPHSYDALIKAFEPRLLRAAFKITLNREDAEDAVQNTFVQVYRNIEGFRGDCQFTSWLTKIAMNQALMLIRKKKRAVVSIDTTNEDGDRFYCQEIPEPGRTPEQNYLRRELEDSMLGFVTKLRKNTRPIFEMYFSEELPAGEIARRMGLSVAAVKSRLLRGKRDMRAMADRAFSSKANRRISSNAFRPPAL